MMDRGSAVFLMRTSEHLRRTDDYRKSSTIIGVVFCNTATWIGMVWSALILGVYIRGEKNFVCLWQSLCHQSAGSSWGLPQSGLHFSWFLVAVGEQFVFTLLEIKEFYKEKCTSHTTMYREYYYM